MCARACKRACVCEEYPAALIISETQRKDKEEVIFLGALSLFQCATALEVMRREAQDSGGSGNEDEMDGGKTAALLFLFF